MYTYSTVVEYGHVIFVRLYIRLCTLAFLPTYGPKQFTQGPFLETYYKLDRISKRVEPCENHDGCVVQVRCNQQCKSLNTLNAAHTIHPKRNSRRSYRSLGSKAGLIFGSETTFPSSSNSAYFKSPSAFFLPRCAIWCASATLQHFNSINLCTISLSTHGCNIESSRNSL